METTRIKLTDKGRGHVWLAIRDGVVVGAMGSEPSRFVGLSVEHARHLARYGRVPRARRAMCPHANVIELSDRVRVCTSCEAVI